MKQLLTFSLAIMLALGVCNAEAYHTDLLDEVNIMGVYNSTYDSETQTVTFEAYEAWFGWYYDNADLSEYDRIVISFAELNVPVQFVVMDTFGSVEFLNIEPTGITQVELSLDGIDKTSVMLIYLMCIGELEETENGIFWYDPESGEYLPPTIVLTEAYLVSDYSASIYLMGTMNGWSANDDWKFTTSDGTTYNLSNVTLDAGSEFKIADSTWSNVDLGGNYAIELYMTYKLVSGGSNLSVSETLENVHLSLNLEKSTLFVTGFENYDQYKKDLSDLNECKSALQEISNQLAEIEAAYSEVMAGEILDRWQSCKLCCTDTIAQAVSEIDLHITENLEAARTSGEAYVSVQEEITAVVASINDLQSEVDFLLAFAYTVIEDYYNIQDFFWNVVDLLDEMTNYVDSNFTEDFRNEIAYPIIEELRVVAEYVYNIVYDTPVTYDLFGEMNALISEFEWQIQDAWDQIYMEWEKYYAIFEEDWTAVCALAAELPDMGWTPDWDLTQGIYGANKISELTIEDGRIVSLDLSGKGLSGSVPASLAGLTALKTLYLYNNQLTGNVGLIGQALPALTTLDVSNNCFSDLYPAMPETIEYLNIDNQTIDRTVNFDLTNLNLTLLAAQIPTIVLYDQYNRTFATNLDLIVTDQSADDFDWWSDEHFAMEVIYSDGNVNIYPHSNQNTYSGENGGMLTVLAYSPSGNFTGTNFKMTLSFAEGDANFDASVDILDLQTIIAYIFEAYTYYPFNFTASNLWDDDMINVQDAVCMVNMLCAQEINAANNMPRYAAGQAEPLCYIEGNKLMISSAQPVAAFDIVLADASALEMSAALKQQGFSIETVNQGAYTRVIGYSLSLSTLDAGIVEIATLDAGSVARCMLSNAEAQQITSNASTTGIGEALSKASIRIANGKLILSNCPAHGMVSLYTISGQLIFTQALTSSEMQIDLPLTRGEKAIVIISAEGANPIARKIAVE